MVIERLGDLFEPALCDEYARLFTRVVELLRPEWKALIWSTRYERVRRTRPCEHKESKPSSCSLACTLGADVAVTSVILDAGEAAVSCRKHPLRQDRAKTTNSSPETRGFCTCHYSYPRSGSLVDRLSKWNRSSLPTASWSTLIRASHSSASCLSAPNGLLLRKPRLLARHSS